MAPPFHSQAAATPSPQAVTHTDAANALASLMHLFSQGASSPSTSSNALSAAATAAQMNPYDFLQAMSSFSPASSFDHRTASEQAKHRPSSEAYNVQPTRSGRLPVVPPSDEINMETFIDFPSESESDDPDFRPPRLAALKAAKSGNQTLSKGKGKALATEDEDEEYVPESDTASGDEEILTAHTLQPVASTSTLPDLNMQFNADPSMKLSEDFWTHQLPDINPSPLSQLPSPLSSYPTPASVPPSPKPRPSLAEAFGLDDPPTPQPEEPKKKKRGRPPKADSEALKKAKIDRPIPARVLNSTSHLPPEERKLVVAERNRRNARMTVEKKKQELVDLRDKVAKLEEENAGLRKTNEALMKDRLVSLGVDLGGPSASRRNVRPQQMPQMGLGDENAMNGWMGMQDLLGRR